MKKYKWIIVLGLLLVLTIPLMAARPPDKGGGDIPDTGELFGDLYVILRDESGVPMLDDNGCIQPISGDLNGDEVLNPGESADVCIETDEGNDCELGDWDENSATPDTYEANDYVITAYEGEPFTLASYIDTGGDAVDCELDVEMTDWVQAVDFGRLNLGRAPDSVINHAFDEAIKNMNLATAIGIDPSGRLVLTRTDGTVKTIDSPAENLALYIKMMKDGHWITEDTAVTVRGGRPPGKGPPEGDGPSSEPRPVLGCANVECTETTEAITFLSLLDYGGLGVDTRTNTDLTKDELLLAASLLAAAADKTGNITLDKVMYINSIYGINQEGSLLGEVDGKTYFDFGGYEYERDPVYANRSSGVCDSGSIYVLQPNSEHDEGDNVLHYATQCMEILGYPSVNAVRFTNMVEAYTTITVTETDMDGNPYQTNAYDFINNVRAFTKAADDALQVLEYIHNYKVPEVLYPEAVSGTAVSGTAVSGTAVKDTASLAVNLTRRPK